MAWDVDKAVKHLTSNAQGSSTGKCARYVREAIEAGGVTLARTLSAKDYGVSLLAAGFSEQSPAPATYAKGDVVVIAGFAAHPHGHIAMYDGSNWVSDFSQSGLYPGANYRKEKPSYKVYRYRPVTISPVPPEPTYRPPTPFNPRPTPPLP